MPFGVISNVALEELEINLKEMMGSLLPEKSKRKKVRVPEALALLTQEEASKLIDMEKVTKEAIERTEQSGIVFVDEIDKITSRGHGQGPDVSRIYCRYEAWSGKDGAYPLYRSRRIPHLEAF
jgi:ATP-dependent HslUV protease ATP-binding subunit HslU